MLIWLNAYITPQWAEYCREIPICDRQNNAISYDHQSQEMEWILIFRVVCLTLPDPAATIHMRQLTWLPWEAEGRLRKSRVQKICRLAGDSDPNLGGWSANCGFLAVDQHFAANAVWNKIVNYHVLPSDYTSGFHLFRRACESFFLLCRVEEIDPRSGKLSRDYSA